MIISPKSVTLFAGLFVFALPTIPASAEIDANRMANSVVLTPAQAANLKVETFEADIMDFEETLLAIGRLRAHPAKRGLLSSRIDGKLVELSAFEGDHVEKGQVIATIESRQPGNPPPRIPLTAPISGTVMPGHANLGSPVSPDTAILEIVDTSELWAVAQVPEDAAGKLQKGMSARISIAALPDLKLVATLDRFGLAADPTSGTVEALFTLANADGQLRPGMRAEFAIITETKTVMQAVPLDALQGTAANRYIYLKDFELPNAYLKSPVTIGSKNDQYAELLTGAFPGDEVVTKGGYALGYVGGGGISLKEALDAAHGHEHNEDGSEMTAEDRRKKAAAREEASGGGSKNSGPLTLFLAALSAILFVLLILSLISGRKRQRQSPSTLLS